MQPLRKGFAHRVSQETYDRLSRWYGLFADPFEARCRAEAVAMLSVQPGERVLEIGPGTGTGLAALARAAKEPGRVVGVDISSGMLRHARRRMLAETSAVAGLVLGDAVELPLDSGSFEAALMSFTLELFSPDDMRRVLAQVHRILRPTGRLAVASLWRGAKPGLSVRAYEALHRAWPSLVDCRPIDLDSVVAEAAFRLQGGVTRSLWGLPVRLIVARPVPQS